MVGNSYSVLCSGCSNKLMGQVQDFLERHEFEAYSMKMADPETSGDFFVQVSEGDYSRLHGLMCNDRESRRIPDMVSALFVRRYLPKEDKEKEFVWGEAHFRQQEMLRNLRPMTFHPDCRKDLINGPNGELQVRKKKKR